MPYSVDHFINGQRLSTDSTPQGDIYNPATGDIAGRVALADQKTVNQAVVAAKAAFPAWSSTPPLKRARVLFNFKNLLEQHIDELAQLVTQEHGKVLDDARGSVMRGIELVEFLCGIPNLLKGEFSENVSAHIDCYTVRQPLGVCMGVTPFNFPVMVPVWMFATAIACGNTFVLKPSEKDPSVVIKLAELLQAAGLPDGVFNVVNGDKAAVDALLHHPDIVAVACVGSTPVAKYIYDTAQAQGKRAQCFGGAKNHCVVMPDADLDDAASAISGAAFGSAGERCMALSVVLAVGDDVANGLIERISKDAQNITIAPGTDPQSDMGPLVTKEHHARVKNYIDSGVKAGATLVIDGREHQVTGFEKGFFMGATLFDHVTPEMQIYREEIFGPVLCVLRVESFVEALELVNTHEFGNGTAIFTSSGEVAREYSTRVQVGMVGINVPIPVPVAYHSFGGWKHSVFADVHLHGPEGIRFYTKPKTVTARWPKIKHTGSAYHMPTN